ncbi:MAG: uroporphyrinogen-III synthase [Gallionella sp.]|nr:uroporphyrinogen-III synthase [Gallionella sp.]
MKSGHARTLSSNSPSCTGEGGAGALCAFDVARPLAGLKILVTRPRDQATPLAQAIEQAGGVALLFPLLDIAPVQDEQALQQQISHLSDCNLTIFVSPNAVQYGMAAIRASGMSAAQVPNIATVGLGSAKALHEAGVAKVIVPVERFDSEGLLAMPELQHIAGWRVMIFRGDGGRELLGDTLKSRGATLEYVTCYRRSQAQQPVSELLRAQPDVITVSSSEALGYLWQMLDVQARMALCKMPLFAPHQRIAELAHRQGWAQVHLTGAGDEGLLSALLAWAERKAIS